jgi:hypothetical protein
LQKLTELEEKIFLLYLLHLLIPQAVCDEMTGLGYEVIGAIKSKIVNQQAPLKLRRIHTATRKQAKWGKSKIQNRKSLHRVTAITLTNSCRPKIRGDGVMVTKCKILASWHF